MSKLREFIKASDEHEREFRATFELKPQYRGDSYWEDAYDCAARYKLYSDEMNIVGEAIQRKASVTTGP